MSYPIGSNRSNRAPLASDSHYRTVAKLLHIALSYTSREARIEAMLNCPDIEVAMYAQILRANGLLTKLGSTIRPNYSAGNALSGTPQPPFEP
jgi:hypothetical protein